MKLTYEQRQALIGKSFSHSRAWPTSLITICDIVPNAGGFTVKFTRTGATGIGYCGLQKFIKRYKRELMGDA